MAGLGTRLRPHTWSKPKPLVSAAGKAVLGHVLDIVTKAGDPANTELIFIIGYMGEQVKPYMQENYPEIKAHYYVQQEMKGQSHAIAMAREHLHGQTLIIFVDTIVDADLSYLAESEDEAIIWVKQVADPRRFGVVDVGEDGFVKGMIEKPDSMKNDLAIVGYYYFNKGEDLLAAIDAQINNKMITKGEYYIADAMTVMIRNGLKMRPETVDVWLDAGLPDTVLESNRYLLEHGRDNTATVKAGNDVTIRPPVYVHPSATLTDCIIGPFTSVGAGCEVRGSTVADSVLEPGAKAINAELKDSILGVNARVENLVGSFNIGDNSSATS
jgi:glucose-1-phosphate thymidylyltransferase